MKLAAAVLMMACILTGCTAKNTHLDQAMELRKRILDASSCEFEATVNADYGDEVYTFEIACTADNTGKLDFTVIKPESISGITGSISDTGVSLTFDDAVLAFPTLADGKVSPVTAPWLLLKTLRSGYLSGCAEADGGLLISMDDSFEENPLHVEISTDDQCTPIAAQIYWQQQRVIALEVRNFSLQ